MSTQFSVGPTRDVQAGDTPDLNDGLLSRPQSTASIFRGDACYMVDGFITIGTVAFAALGHSPFVPIESVNNSGAPGTTNMSGVTAPQRIALGVTTSVDLLPGDYVKVNDASLGDVEKWDTTGDDANLKYARYLGREAALLDRNDASPFDETLTVGIVPDQTILASEPDGTVGWFQLVENPGEAP